MVTLLQYYIHRESHIPGGYCVLLFVSHYLELVFLAPFAMFLISGHHDQYDIISSWEVEQNQAVKAATKGKASPAKNQT